MGFPNNNHIKTFVKGQTIVDIVEDETGQITLRFTGGESLRLAPRIKRQQADIETIATPFRSDGEVKQTTEITELLSTTMKLDRNINKDGRGKYALIKLRDAVIRPPNVRLGTTEVTTQAIDFGDTYDSDFFVIRLKDKYAGAALEAYGRAALADDPEYSQEILRLAEMARNHPSKKMPD